jgi:hypothetical protein
MFQDAYNRLRFNFSWFSIAKRRQMPSSYYMSCFHHRHLRTLFTFTPRIFARYPAESKYKHISKNILDGIISLQIYKEKKKYHVNTFLYTISEIFHISYRSIHPFWQRDRIHNKNVIPILYSVFLLKSTFLFFILDVYSTNRATIR